MDEIFIDHRGAKLGMLLNFFQNPLGSQRAVYCATATNLQLEVQSVLREFLL